MLTITVKVTPDCEELLTTFPRYAEVELTQEDYEDDGGVLEIILHTPEDLSAIRHAMAIHSEVIEYTIEE